MYSASLSFERLFTPSTPTQKQDDARNTLPRVHRLPRFWIRWSSPRGRSSTGSDNGYDRSPCRRDVSCPALEPLSYGAAVEDGR